MVGDPLALADRSPEKSPISLVLVGTGVEQAGLDQHRARRGIAGILQRQLELDRHLVVLDDAAPRLEDDLDPRPQASRHDSARDRRRSLGRGGRGRRPRRRGALLRRDESVELRPAGKGFARAVAPEQEGAAGAEHQGREKPRPQQKPMLGPRDLPAHWRSRGDAVAASVEPRRVASGGSGGGRGRRRKTGELSGPVREGLGARPSGRSATGPGSDSRARRRGRGLAGTSLAAPELPVGRGRGALRAGGVGRRGAATGSADRVTVPFSVKFWRSRGPIDVGRGRDRPVVAASWASAGAGASASPTAKTTPPKRKTALINSRFLLVNRATMRARAHASQSPAIQALLR